MSPATEAATAVRSGTARSDRRALHRQTMNPAPAVHTAPASPSAVRNSVSEGSSDGGFAPTPVATATVATTNQTAATNACKTSALASVNRRFCGPPASGRMSFASLSALASDYSAHVRRSRPRSRAGRASLRDLILANPLPKVLAEVGCGDRAEGAPCGASVARSREQEVRSRLQQVGSRILGLQPAWRSAG